MKTNNRIFVNSAFTAISLILLIASHINCSGNVAFAESSPPFTGAAPYTEDAVKKIDAAYKQVGVPKIDLSVSIEERFLKILEFERAVYASVGYSYDATLKEVAYDLQIKSSRLQKHHVTVAGYIVGEVHVMMSECQSQKVDCLKLYPSDIADAVRTILKTSKFSM